MSAPEKFESFADTVRDSIPSLLHLIEGRDGLRDFLRDVDSLATILDAYNNVNCGKRGREGLWTFEGELVNDFKVTIRKPSPRDLPDVSIIDVESRKPISLSQLVIRTRDKFDLVFGTGEGPDYSKIQSELSKVLRMLMSIHNETKATFDANEARREEAAAKLASLKTKIDQEKADVERRNGECQLSFKRAREIAKLGYWSLAGAITQIIGVAVTLVAF